MARQRGITVHQLNIGQSDLPTPPAFFKAVKSYSSPVIDYAPSAGEPATIKAWQKYYRRAGLPYKEGEIIVTTGGSEAILFALFAATDPGDEVIVFEPLYPNYITFASIAGIKLRAVTLRYEQGFRLPSAAEINRAVGPRTRAILVCNPDNPTGTVRTPKEVKELLGIARRKNLYVIADETYTSMVFSPYRTLSFSKPGSTRDRVILVDSASKRFNVCGARIGCLATTNKDVYMAAIKFAQSRLSSPTLEQAGVIPLLSNPRHLTGQLKREYQRRSTTVVEHLRKIPGVSFISPRGSFYIFVQLPVDDTEKFCRWLVEDFSYRGETVLLAPGSGFYITPGLGRHYVRIASVLGIAKLHRAMVILKRGLSAYKSVER